MRRTLTPTLASLLVVIPVAAHAQDKGEKNKDRLEVLVKTFMDDGKPLKERHSALASAAAAIRNKAEPQRVNAVKSSVLDLLKQLGSKKDDALYESFIAMAIATLEPISPLPEAQGVVKSFLPSKGEEVKRAAIKLVRITGCPGVQKELAAIIQEPVEGSPKRNKGRENLEVQVVGATKSIPAADSQYVLSIGAKDSRFKLVRYLCIDGIRDMLVKRPPGECNEPEARKVLLELSKVDNRDEYVACYAGLALMRFNTYEGIAEVMKRVDKAGGSEVVYQTLCQASHNPTGFLGVEPQRYLQVDSVTRGTVIQAMHEWWDRVKTQRPDNAIFEAMKGQGISVPANLDSKDAIDALIEGLIKLEVREQRYTVLDLLIRKTGRVDFAKDFRVYVEKLGSSVKIEHDEPAEGFPAASKHATELREQQRQKARDFQGWWQKAKSGAKLVNGVWQTS